MKKTIALFELAIDANKFPFSHREIYYYSHQDFLLAMKRAGADAYFVSGNDTYLGGGKFSKAWTVDHVVEQVIEFREVDGITADLVFDKGGFTGFQGTDIPIVTDHAIRPVMYDKAKINAQFGKFQPRTVLCEDEAALKQAVANMPGEMVVAKNPVGSGGRNVYIAKKTELTIPANETYPLLVQEFIDMSEGVPGIVQGPHDLRILVCGAGIIGATLRQPVSGSLHSNVSQGGSERLLTRDEIPAEVVAMVQEIDATMKGLPRYYSIDFARGTRQWYLIELNNEPGFFRESNGPLARGFMESLAKYLVEL